MTALHVDRAPGADKGTYPGMLDNMVAGGQPCSLGLKENMVKNAARAGVPEIAQRVQPVGMISDHQSDDGAKPDRQYCFDLEVPADFGRSRRTARLTSSSTADRAGGRESGTRLRSSSIATWSSSIS